MAYCIPSYNATDSPLFITERRKKINEIEFKIRLIKNSIDEIATEKHQFKRDGISKTAVCLLSELEQIIKDSI